jgi:hypothetical protein
MKALAALQSGPGEAMFDADTQRLAGQHAVETGQTRPREGGHRAKQDCGAH